MRLILQRGHRARRAVGRHRRRPPRRPHPRPVLLPPPADGRARRPGVRPPPRRGRRCADRDRACTSPEHARGPRRVGAVASPRRVDGGRRRARPGSPVDLPQHGRRCSPCQRSGERHRRRPGRRAGRGPRRWRPATTSGCRRGAAPGRRRGAARRRRRAADAARPRRRPGRRRRARRASDAPRSARRARRSPAARSTTAAAASAASTSQPGVGGDRRWTAAATSGTSRRRRRAASSSPIRTQFARRPSRNPTGSSPATGGPREQEVAARPRRPPRQPRSSASTSRLGPLGQADPAARRGARPSPSRRAAAPPPAARGPSATVTDGPVPDRQRRSSPRRQVDALDRHVGRRAARQQVRPGEGARRSAAASRWRPRRRVQPTAVGDRPDALHGVAAGDPQPGLEHRRARRRGAGGRRPRRRGRVPAVVGGDVPRPARRAVPRHDRPASGDVGPPRLPEHTRWSRSSSRPSATARTGVRRHVAPGVPAQRGHRTLAPWRRAVLIPVKRFTAAKGRLSVLCSTARQRAELARWLADRSSPRRATAADVRRLRRRRGGVVGRRRRRRGAVEPGARSQRRRRRRPGDGRRQGVRPHRHRPQRPAAGPPTSAPVAVADTVDARARPPARRHQRDGPARRRRAGGGATAPARSAATSRWRWPTGRRVEVRRDPALALDVDSPPTCTHPRSSPHLPPWLRTILDSRR